MDQYLNFTQSISQNIKQENFYSNENPTSILQQSSSQNSNLKQSDMNAKILKQQDKRSFENKYNDDCCQIKDIKDRDSLQDFKQQEITNSNSIDEISKSMITQRKEKRSKIKVGDLEDQQQKEIQQQQQNYEKNIGNIYNEKTSLSSVDLSYNSSINKFVIKKQYKKNKDQQIEKEFHILDKLKGNNITLDVIQYEINSFQQIAGKTNLKQLKQKTNENYIYDIFYLILLEKLNKMHEHGIAHSDIKPQNIVISYENEPFFIDFGGSIYLSNEKDFENYLTSFTRAFNLRRYFEKYDQKINEYQTQKFTSIEEIKLCDQTQLSLTFLYLFCEDQNQKKLFYFKNYNQLIYGLIDKSSGESLNFKNLNKIDQDFYYSMNQYKKNRMIVLSIICRILNKADPNIILIKENLNQQIFFVEENYIQKELVKSTDITLQGQVYTVQCIDKFNISLVYFLYKQNFELNIDPKNMHITPLPEMKEYQLISKNYKINKYLENLLYVEQELDDYEFMNILEFLIAYKIQKHKILIKNPKQFKLLFQIISNQITLNIFEIIIEIDFFHLKIFIESLKVYQPRHFVQKFEIFEQRIICSVIDSQNQNQKMPHVNVIYHILIKNQSFQECFKQFQDNQIIKQLQLSIKYSYNFIDEAVNIEKEIKKNFKFQIKLMKEQSIKSILFQRSLNSKFYSQCSYRSEKIKNKMFQNFQCQYHKKQIQEDLNGYIKTILQESQQQQPYNLCSYCQDNFYKMKKYISLQVEQLTCQIFKMKHINQQTIIKIFDYFFEQIDMWLEIQKFLETQNNNGLIQLILVNCKFSHEVDKIINEIKTIYQYKVKFESIEYYEVNEYDYQQYQFSIQQNQELNIEETFEIIFAKEVILKKSKTNQKEKGYQQIIKEEETRSVIAEDNNYQNDQEKINSDSIVEKINQIFDLNQEFQFSDFRVMQIEFENQQQIYEQKILLMHIYEKQLNKENIDILIKNIQNFKQYSDIILYDKQNPSIYFFQLQDFNNIKICCQNDDNEKLNWIFELFLSIYRIYYIDNNHSYYSLRKLDIQLQINYSQYQVVQQILYKSFDDNLYSFINQFQGVDQYQNCNGDPNSKQESFLLVNYNIQFKDKQILENLDIQSEFIEKREGNHFNASINFFQQYSLPNSEFTSFIFKNQIKLYQFNFKFEAFHIQQIEACFKIFIEEIEKVFPENKIYSLQFQKGQIFIDQVIKTFLEDKNYQDINFLFIFNTKRSVELTNKIIQYFQNNLKIYDIDEFNIAIQSKNLKQKSKTILLYLKFDEDVLNQNLKINNHRIIKHSNEIQNINSFIQFPKFFNSEGSQVSSDKPIENIRYIIGLESYLTNNVEQNSIYPKNKQSDKQNNEISTKLLNWDELKKKCDN